MFTWVAIGMCKPKACLHGLRKSMSMRWYDVARENEIGPETYLRGSRWQV